MRAASRCPPARLPGVPLPTEGNPRRRVRSVCAGAIVAVVGLSLLAGCIGDESSADTLTIVDGEGGATGNPGLAGADAGSNAGVAGADAGGNAGVGGADGAGDSARTGGSAGSGGGCSCGPLEECEEGGRCVAKSVAVATGFAIDATEVTRSQYEAWLASKPTMTGQSPRCTSNTTLVPDAGCMSSARACQGMGCGGHPQVCVDWCDAWEYCAGAGKRLCGKIGKGPSGYDDYATVSSSQWYAASTSGGLHDYPYGDVYGEQVCNGADNAVTGCASGACTTVVVGSLKGCVSETKGYGGVYDLSGNVWEWEDSCLDTGSPIACRLRGGSFSGGGDSLRCDSACNGSPGYGFDGVGFRCCSR